MLHNLNGFEAFEDILENNTVKEKVVNLKKKEQMFQIATLVL